MGHSRYISGLGERSQLTAATFLLFLCSLIGCSTEEEMQRARLIEARGYDKDTPLDSFPLPVDGGGIIGTSTIIELVFDKPVLEVSINYSAKAQPDEMPPTTIWTVESNRLAHVWNRQIEGSPDKEVVLMVIYEDETGIHKDTLDVTLDLQSNSPRVIAVEPIPGFRHSEAVELSALTQEFRVIFNEPIIPSSGCILFGNSRIQLQETEPTDVITWNQCFRRIRFGLEPGSLVIRDFVNVNYDVQPHAFEGWYWMPLIDPAPPVALEYYPIGENVDPKTTREIRVVFNSPMGQAFVDISPAIEVVFMGIENEDVRKCSGIATWRFVNLEQLDYSTKYDVTIRAEDEGGNQVSVNFSFTTREAPASD